MSETCKTCRFWETDSNGSGVHGYHTDGSFSNCRAHSPIMIDDTKYRFEANARWPVTGHWAWCGDYEARKAQSSEPRLSSESPLHQLELDIRVCNALVNDGYKTIGQVAATSDAVLVRTQNFGRKSLQAVRAAIDAALGEGE